MSHLNLLTRFKEYRHLRLTDTQQNVLRRICRRCDHWFYKDDTEYLEQSGVPFTEQVAIVNRLGVISERTGYHFAFIQQLDQLIRRLHRPSTTPIRIIDIGMGSGALLRAIWHWSQKRNIKLELYGLDLSADFVKSTQANLTSQNIPVQLFVGNACDPQLFPENHFDITISSAVIHHIRDVESVALLLSNIYRISREGWLLVDYSRNPLGLWALMIGFLSGGNALLFSDGLKSYRRAYAVDEINFILQEIPGTSNMLCKAYPLFPLFWTISGQKKT